MKKLSALFISLVCSLLVVSTRGATVTGNTITACGNPTVSYLRFVPRSTPIAYGSNTVIGFLVRASVDTNNNFSAFLVGGFYDTFFGSDPIPPLRILVPINDTNTYTLNQAAQLAVNAGMFGLSSVVITQTVYQIGFTNAVGTNGIGAGIANGTLTVDGSGAVSNAISTASNNVVGGVWVPPGGSSLTNGQTGNVQFTNSTITVSNLLSLGAITGASVAPSAQSSGQLNINLGSGTLSGSTVNVGNISGNGAGLTSIPYSALTGTPSIPSTNGLGSAAYTSSSAYDVAGAATAATNTASLVRTNSTGVNLSGAFTGNGGGLTNLTGALNFLTVQFAASNNIVDPKALQDLNGYWGFLHAKGLDVATNGGLLDGIALRSRMHSDQGKVTLRGNVFTWANPAYDPNGWGAWINPTSTISLTLPYAISNFTVVVSFRQPYGDKNGGPIFRLSDPVTYSSVYLTKYGKDYWYNENNGSNATSFFPGTPYQLSVSGTNFGTNSFFPPCEQGWTATTANGCNANLKEGPRSIERKVITLVHMANGTVFTYQDSTPCKFSYYFLTNSYTTITPSAVPFTRLDLGIDIARNDQNIFIQDAVFTNYYLSSIQIFLTTNTSPSVIGAEYGASYWLEDEDYFDVFYGHSRMQPVVNNYGISWNATNSWPLFYEAEKSGNTYFNYHNQAEGGTDINNMNGTYPPGGWKLDGGFNEITNLPFDKIKTVNLFSEFTENNIKNGNSVATTIAFVTNAYYPLIAANIPQLRWNWISSWQFWTNATGTFSAVNETNMIAADMFEWTNTVDQTHIPWNYYDLRSHITQFMLNTTNGFGLSKDGIHFMTTNTAPNKAIAHYILTREWLWPQLSLESNNPVIY